MGNKTVIIKLNTSYRILFNAFMQRSNNEQIMFKMQYLLFI